MGACKIKSAVFGVVFVVQGYRVRISCPSGCRVQIIKEGV